MFMRPVNVRLKAAEKALEGGRLDAALEAAGSPDVRKDRRGQKLLDEIARPLLARARVHFQNGRYHEALGDLTRLEEIERFSPDADALRQRVQHELHGRGARDAHRQQAAAVANRQIEEGRLESARVALEQVEDAQRRAQLAQNLDARIRRSDELIAQGEAALTQGDIAAALRLWQESTRRHGTTQRSEALARRLAGAWSERIERHFREGRVDALLLLAPAIAALKNYDHELGQFEHIARLCEQAAAQVRACGPQELRETLLRLRSGRTGVAWVNDALEAAGQLARAHETLLGGPLGGLGSVQHARTEPAPHPAPPPSAPELHAAEPDGASLATPLAVLIDGGASGLLLAGNRVRIGRAGADQADIPIPGDVQSHHADIERIGEDYFLTPRGPVEINQHRVSTRMLLRDGDRIALGQKVRMTFHLPSARSASAVLRMSHRCRLAHDVSEIVLLAETCLVGPQPSCHLRTREGRDQAVLFERGGRLFGRGVYANGLAEKPRPLPLRRSVEFGELRLTLKPYSDSAADGVV